MKTELIHSYSSVSLSGLSRSVSQVSLHNGTAGGGGGPSNNNINGKHSVSQTGLMDDPKIEHSGTVVEVLKEWSRHTFRKKILYKKVPFLSWVREYNVKKGISDLIAGLTVGLTILPQALAYASLSGVPAQYGLYSGFVGSFVYIFLGSTKAVTIGPTASMAIISLSYGSGKPPEFTVILTFLLGLITLGMGILQLGFIVNFISTPVMSGFTSAVAITIVSTQVKSLLGLQFNANGIVDVIDGLVKTVHETKLHDTLLSIICIVALIFLQNLQNIFKCAKNCSSGMDKILWFISTSRSAIVVVICTVIYAVLGDPSPVGVVGDIVAGLPPFQVPDFEFGGNSSSSGEWVTYTFSKVVKESSSALVVLPILAIMEHVTSAKAIAAAGMSRVDATQEMVTIGLANLIGSFFSSIPVTGSFSRTMVNHASGVETPAGGLVTGLLVILALQFLTPYFFYIPNAALASVIVCAVIFTIDFTVLRPMWRSKRMDIIPWGVTFIVSLILGLEYGILSGFLISLLFLLYYAARPGVRVNRGETSTGIEFILVDLDRSLTFPSVEYTNYVILKSGTNWAKNRLPVVIDCQHIQFADYTAAQGMQEIFTIFKAKNQELVLWRVKPSVLRIINGVMEYTKTDFKYCSTEADLEIILEARRIDLEKDNPDIKITFTMEGDDDDESTSHVSTGSDEYQL